MVVGPPKYHLLSTRPVERHAVLGRGFFLLETPNMRDFFSGGFFFP